MELLQLPLSPPQIVDGITLKFPAKLWRIVNNCKTGAIGWESDGISVKINKKLFESQYLSSSSYFKTTNFPSFIRQLNIYGFRKVPIATRWQESGTVFEYKHEYFVRGHPELLTEVVRNTAVRRTQRENAIKHAEAIIAQGNLSGKLPHEPKGNPLLTKHVPKSVDESHPLLKSPAAAIMKYGVPVEPLQNHTSTVTTVYMNPRVAVCDMQRMSPGKLHNQVAGLLTAINDEDEVLITDSTNNRNSDTDIVDDSRDNTGRQETQMSTVLPTDFYPGTENLHKPILFLPRNNDNTFDITNNVSNIPIDQLSQDSTTSQQNQHLMFSSSIDKDDEHDNVFDESLDQSLSFSCQEDFEELNAEDSGSVSKGFQLEGNTRGTVTCNGFNIGMDMFSPSLNMADTLAQFGEEEQGFLTPAYFDPDTGTVTLLLPALNPES